MYCKYVKEFTKLATGKELPEEPKKMTTKDIDFLCKMVSEELEELKEAKTIGEQADALIDAIYYILDSGVKKGIDLDPIFRIIHENNLTKVKNKKIARNEDGKIEKPIHWKDPGPLIEEEIKKQSKKD